MACLQLQRIPRFISCTKLFFPSLRPPLYTRSILPTRLFHKTANPPYETTPDPKFRPTAADAKKLLSSLRSIPAHENIYTVPNMLTFSRILATPFVGYLIIHEQYPLALGTFVAAGVTDLLDGYIARRFNMKTVVGSIIDPAADKALMTVLTVTLAVQGLLPVPVALIILGRDTGLILASFYYRYISLPHPKTFLRYWDFSIPSAEVKPTTISKVNTALQLVLMGASLTNPVFAWPEHMALTTLQYTVATTTIWSGLSYVFSKDAVKILHETKK
ncbi:CDP-alcohol phosphatidyltransferase-domain-containing protein [Jimgerdemannia flammicorona]|uniref:CDP-alcohol phosphatidyltransferase-domain-containing protein n=1 Tax=Jimgerdemannia flammicorona TaxID=994334 RepID=A0A433DCV7_9FUNG|nr:CDP-alcohol phosphatidyltransferase-domain-containing protein [Jimgerdemannia flammicorona]